MLIAQALALAVAAGYTFVHKPADDDSVDDSFALMKGDVEMNIHLQVDSSDPQDEVCGLWKEKSLKTDDGWTLQWTHYFFEEITEELVNQFIADAIPLEEARREYTQFVRQKYPNFALT
jgi:hypothetical protein